MKVEDDEKIKFLFDLEKFARLNQNTAPIFSGLLSFLSTVSVISINLLIVDTQILLTLILTTTIAVFFVIPLAAFVRSKPMTRLERSQLGDQLSVKGLDRFSLRLVSSGEASAYDMFFFRFAIVPIDSLSGEDCADSNTLKCRIVHELAHLQNRDPLRLSFLASCSLISIFSLIMFAVKISIDPVIDRVSFAYNSNIIFIIISSYFIVSTFTAISLWQFIHQREFSADGVGLQIIGNGYKTYISERAIFDKFLASKNFLIGAWNKLTHPSFTSRKARLCLGSKNSASEWICPVTLIQSHVVVSNIFIFIVLLEPSIELYIWENLNFPIFLQYTDVFFMGLGLFQWMIIASSYAIALRSSARINARGLLVLMLLALALFHIDGWLLRSTLEIMYLGSVHSIQLESLVQFVLDNPITQPSAVLISVLALTALVRLTPNQSYRPLGLRLIQAVNDSILTTRLYLLFLLNFLDEKTFSDFNDRVQFLLFSLLFWFIGELCIEIARRLRVRFWKFRLKCSE